MHTTYVIIGIILNQPRILVPLWRSGWVNLSSGSSPFIMTWLRTCISEYIAFPFSLNEDFIAVQYFLKNPLASTLMLQRHTSWYLCTLQNPLFSFNFDLQSCYLFEMFNKSKTKLNNMGLIILTNLIINFKMIERS